MYRIVYKSDIKRVLLLGSETKKQCEEFLDNKGLNRDEYIIEVTGVVAPQPTMLLCTEVNKEFNDMFHVGESYPIISKSPNGRAWNIQRTHDTTTFVSVDSVFGKFEEIL